MSSDRNLLFGIVAVQMNFISRDGLIEAMNAWVLEKDRNLSDVLFKQGQLTPERRQLLEALVNEHLKAHGNDPQRSLAALSSVPGTLRQQLAALPDEAVRQSIACVGVSRQPAPVSEPEPNETVALPPPGPERYRILRPHAKAGLARCSWPRTRSSAGR
jgi:eukaryotic-like serine/threonine-protein kinase